MKKNSDIANLFRKGVAGEDAVKDTETPKPISKEVVSPPTDIQEEEPEFQEEMEQQEEQMMEMSREDGPTQKILAQVVVAFLGDY
jgi:hypothetical protein